MAARARSEPPWEQFGRRPGISRLISCGFVLDKPDFQILFQWGARGSIPLARGRTPLARGRTPLARGRTLWRAAPLEDVPQAKKKQKTGPKPASNAEHEAKSPPPWKPQSKHSAAPPERVIRPPKVPVLKDLKNKQTKGDKTSHHSEIMHWAAGDMAKTLSEKAKELRREHDGQFKKRQQEFYDAARKKDKQGYYEEEF